MNKLDDIIIINSMILESNDEATLEKKIKKKRRI